MAGCWLPNFRGRSGVLIYKGLAFFLFQQLCEVFESASHGIRSSPQSKPETLNPNTPISHSNFGPFRPGRFGRNLRRLRGRLAAVPGRHSHGRCLRWPAEGGRSAPAFVDFLSTGTVHKGCFRRADGVSQTRR